MNMSLIMNTKQLFEDFKIKHLNSEHKIEKK